MRIAKHKLTTNSLTFQPELELTLAIPLETLLEIKTDDKLLIEIMSTEFIIMIKGLINHYNLNEHRAKQSNE